MIHGRVEHGSILNIIASMDLNSHSEFRFPVRVGGYDSFCLFNANRNKPLKAEGNKTLLK